MEHIKGKLEVDSYNLEIALRVRWSDQNKPGETNTYGDANGALIAKIEHQGEAAPVVTRSQAAANARHLAACWNACEGISTEALESDELREVMHVLKDGIDAGFLVRTVQDARKWREIEDHQRIAVIASDKADARYSGWPFTVIEWCDHKRGKTK